MKFYLYLPISRVRLWLRIPCPINPCVFVKRPIMLDFLLCVYKDLCAGISFTILHMESRLVLLLIQDMEKLVVKGSIFRRIYMQVFPSIFYVWNQDRN